MRTCNVIVCLFVKLCPKHDNTYLTRILNLYLYAIKKLNDHSGAKLLNHRGMQQE